MFPNSAHKLGQPPKDPMLTNDTKRAFVLHVVCSQLRKDQGLMNHDYLPVSNRNLVEIAINMYPKYTLFSRPVYYNKMLASLKRGRRYLGLNSQYIPVNPKAPGGSLFNRS